MTCLHIYTRVSTATQEDEGSSLDTQAALGVEKAEALGMEYQVWNEGAQSSAGGDLSTRPVLRSLLSAVEDGQVEHLFVYNTDRLSRNDVTWALIKAKLGDSDVRLHTSRGEYDLSDAMNGMILGIMATVSKYENDLRADRSRLGKINLVKKGYWHGGPPPYGYRIADKRLVVAEREAARVKAIYEMYAAGSTVREIRDWLSSEGVLTRRGKPIWSLGSIEALLDNTHYAGYYYYRDKKYGDRIRCSAPEIVSANLYQEVQQQKANRSEARRVKESSDKHFFLLRDFLRCGECGSRFSGRVYEKQGRSVYYCPRHERVYANKDLESKKCSNRRYLKIAATDELVWKVVIDTLRDSNLYKELVKAEVFEARHANADEQQDTIKRLKRRVRKLRNDEETVQSALQSNKAMRVLNDSSAEELDAVVKTLERKRIDYIAEREALETELAAHQSQSRWVDWLSELGARLERMDDLSPQEQKDVLRRTINKIVVKTLDTQRHELELHFSTPMVGDQLVWRDELDKTKGYELEDGSKTLVVPLKKTGGTI